MTGWKPVMRAFVAASTALALTLVGVAHAQGADVGAFALDSMASTASWSGDVTAGVTARGLANTSQAYTGVPASPLFRDVPCAPGACDVALVDVALPAGTWSADTGGMIVQIRWPSYEAGYDLDLSVYGPDGALAGRSDMYGFSREESVWIPDPANGRWTIAVEPSFIVGQPAVPGMLETLRYEGFVAFERGRTITRQELEYDEPVTRSFVSFGGKSGPLLPDIVPTTPSEFHIESGFCVLHYYACGDRGLAHQPSCYAMETLGLTADQPQPGGGPLRCLRWTQGESNVGDGPLELHIYPDEGDGTQVYQRVYGSDGSVEQFGPSGTASYSKSHLHFHYRGWQDIKLRRLNDDGSLGELVRTGIDKGICMADIDNTRFGQAALPNAPLTYTIPGTCDQPTHRDPADPTFPGARYLQMGISVGHADVYAWYLGDQYIEISGVPDGRYALTVDQDVLGMLRELSTTNNSATGCVEIAGDQARDIPCI